MAADSNQDEQRRAMRQRANFTVKVIHALTGEDMGHLGNLSSSGMMLISSRPPQSAAVYQVQLTLPGAGGHRSIEVGLQEQWHEAAASPGQFWAGYRIIAISDADGAALEAWLKQSS